MTKETLVDNILRKKSYLCVGLDSDIRKIPSHLLAKKDPIFEFNKQIIDATLDYCVSYKPNIAFYEAMGVKGWESLQKTIEYIPKSHFTIADAKRGDIGNTSRLYARTFFDKDSSGLDFDSVTVAPYMGSDSVLPFLEFENKWVILLALTSNQGGADFQRIKTENGFLFEEVLKISQNWASSDSMMYVIGATQSKDLEFIRTIVPDHFLLVPGVGAQGGNLEEVSRYGMNKQCGLLVNASRSIIYAGNDHNFGKEAKKEAKKLQSEMALYLDKYL